MAPAGQESQIGVKTSAGTLYKQKMFWGWDKFCASGICPRLYNIPNMEDPVAQGSGAAAPPYIHWVQASGFVRNVLDVLLHCI